MSDNRQDGNQRTALFRSPKRLLITLFTPQQQDRTARSREIVLITLLAGSMGTVIVMLGALLASYLSGNEYVAGRIAVCVGTLVYLGVTFAFVRHKRYRLAAFLLVLSYCVLATGIAWQWGINLPFGLLMFCVVIVLAGILLGSVYSLYVAALAVAILVCLQWGVEQGFHTPDTSWTPGISKYGDVAGYGCVFALLAGISWLFGREIERSLGRAEEAEAGLKKEKELLATRVEERTAELQAAQFQEIQQLYQFAELGHLGTAMMHELANHLTVLSLDIEDLQRQQSSDVLKRAHRTMKYLDTMVGRVRERLHGNTVNRVFNTVVHVKRTVSIVKQKAAREHVRIKISQQDGSAQLYAYGDSIHFRQIMAVFITNAIEAYHDTRRGTREVLVSVQSDHKNIQISIRDHGKGISAEQRNHIFKPFLSNKPQGMGIGLSIAKATLESQFKGSVALNNTTDYTEFIITLPQHHA